MTLQKQNLDLLFTNGINNKKDDKNTLGIELKVLENGVFNKNGVINKRFGYNSIGITGSNTPKALMVYKNELLRVDDQSICSYSTALSEFNNKNLHTQNNTDDSLLHVESCNIERSPVVSNDYDKANCNAVTVNGLTLYTYIYSGFTFGPAYSIKDNATGSYIKSEVELANGSSSNRVDCGVIENDFYIVYSESGNLYYTRIDSSNPTSASAPVYMASLGWTSPNASFKVLTVGTNIFIAWIGNSNSIKLAKFTSAGAIVGSIVTVGAGIGSLSLTTVYVSYVTYIGLSVNSGSQLKYCAYRDTLTLQVPLTTVTTDYVYASAIIPDIAGTGFLIFGTSGSGAQMKTTASRANLGDGVWVLHDTMYQVELSAKPFFHNSVLYAFLTHNNSTQGFALLFNLDQFKIVTRYAIGLIDTSRNYSYVLPEVVNLGNGKYSVLNIVSGQSYNTGAGGTISFYDDLHETIVDFNSKQNYEYVEINKNLYFVNGSVNVYDGKNKFFQGFTLFPDGCTAVATGTGSSIPAGTYSYAVIYSWIDRNGNKHRSAPEFLSSYTLGSAGLINVTIPTLRNVLDLNKDPNFPVKAEVYRTTNAGTIFYFSGSVDNDQSVATVVYTDTKTDANLSAREILYTEGSVLDNVCVGACNVITVYKNRIFLAGLEKKNEIKYSKIVRDFQGISFNEALTIKCEEEGGNITGLKGMNDKLIIFKEKSLYYLVGDGPSDTGAGATFTDVQLISNTTGCIENRSIVQTNDGIFFKDIKGIHLLTNDLQVLYIGANVEDYNNYEITSAVSVETLDEVRFGTLEGNTLVYNTYFQQWSIFTGQETVDACNWRGKYVFMNDDNVLEEDYSTYKDNGTSVKLKIGTGWIRVSGIQGFQRVYRAMILGDYKSAHDLKVTVYNDYKATLVDTYTFDTSIVSELYQFETHLKNQKCQSIRFVIEDVIDEGADFGTGESMSVNGISLQVGIKKGFNKLNNAFKR